MSNYLIISRILGVCVFALCSCQTEETGSSTPGADKLIQKSVPLAIPKAPAIGPPPPAAKSSYEKLKAQILINNQKIKEARDKIAKNIKESPIDKNARSLLIFLDDSEIASDSIPFTRRAAAAISQKAGPILITGSLLSHTFNIAGQHDADTKDILNILYGEFDAREWTIRQLGADQDFFLMIPGQNLISKELGMKLELKPGEKGSIVPVKTPAKDSLMQYVNALYPKFKNNPNDPKLSANFLKVFKELFIPKSGYEKDNLQPPEYIILLNGHGGFKNSIAGISTKGDPSEFHQLLDIIDKIIVTKIFGTISCYAAGFNFKQIYGELTSKAGTRTYAFPIVTEAITDASTYMGMIEAKGGKIASEVRYDEFVNDAKKELIDFKLALGHVFPLIKRATRWQTEITGLPQLRPANTPAWFPINDVDKAVVRIGKVMALTRIEPLIIKQYEDINGQMQDPKAILLAAESVPFKIIMDKDIIRIPPFISISPGLAVHQLAHVEVGRYWPGIIKALTANIEYGTTKLFWINHLLFRDDKNFNFRDVVIETREKETKAYGTHAEGAQDPKSFTNEKTLLSNYIDHYQALSKKMRFHSELGLTIIDIEWRNKFGETPLIVATGRSDVQGVKLLLEAGADVNAKDTSGFSAIDYASTPEVKEILLAAIKKAAGK